MLTLTPRSQLAIGLLLAMLLIVTRGRHFPDVMHLLPSASWAVFFLAGVYLRPVWVLAGLLGLAALLDYAAIAWGGVSSFCVSPAYGALIPAYGALWFAGRWYAGRYTFKPATLLTLAVAVVFGTAVCELLSSGGFYFFSGRFAEPTLTEFATRFAKYFPTSLASIAFWVVASAWVHAIAVTFMRHGAKPKPT